jgi:lambda family phage portal protein
MTNWIDRAIASVAPRLGVKRLRARLAFELLARHYEANSGGYRTQSWHRSVGDANAAVGGGLSLREHARDLVRNNPHATSAITTIVDHTVGWGIVGAPKKDSASKAAINVARDRWRAWAETTACDADGRQNLYGLQQQFDRTVVEAGECLARRRWRRPEDKLPLPVQIQLLEPDHLDTSRDGIALTGGSRIIQGVEFDAIGRRAAYWLFPEHPGANFAGAGFGSSQRIPASEIIHGFRPDRPAQVRGVTWFAPVILALKEFDGYQDATAVKQRIAACLALITTDTDGTAPTIGKADQANPELDGIYPGMIANLAAGRSVEVVNPPAVSEHESYCRVSLQEIATGLGITYEDLTGNYTGLPFSAARMSRIRHWGRVHGWRWNMLIPQFCDPVWQWAMQAAMVMNLLTEVPAVEWTAPPMPMLEPDTEGLAYQRNIRSGIMTLSEVIRERGYDPETVLAEMKADWTRLDSLGLVLDSDPRKMSQAGMRGQAEVPTLVERIAALGGLIRAGFEPSASLTAVGLPSIAHTGILPVTVQPEEDTKAPQDTKPVRTGHNGHGGH